MGGGHSTYTPKTAVGHWFDARLPLPRMVHDQFIVYPVPRNLNYAYSFGGILSMIWRLRSRLVSCWPCTMRPTLRSPSMR